jgi:hypothetical protein
MITAEEQIALNIMINTALENGLLSLDTKRLDAQLLRYTLKVNFHGVIVTLVWIDEVHEDPKNPQEPS